MEAAIWSGSRPALGLSLVVAVLAVGSVFEGRALASNKQIINLTDVAQGGTCFPSINPVNTAGLRSPVTVTARTNIDHTAPLNPLAAGLDGSVSLREGAGVRSYTCQGAAGVTGGDAQSDEELILSFDNPVISNGISIRTLGLSFSTDDPVIFISTTEGAGFEYVVTKEMLHQAYEAIDFQTGQVDFSNLAILPADTWVDKIIIRETADDFSIGTMIVLAPPKANLDQIRNGSAGSPNNPGVWVNGNAGSSNSHYIESHSIPYRAVMTDLPLNTSITLTLGYDIKHSDHHAIDYLTHYDRLQPHAPIFGHAQETINPLIGVSGVSGTVTTFPIPAPSTTNSPVPGQPATSFNALAPAKRVFTLFGGTITNVANVQDGDLTASQSEARVSVTFTVNSSTAVLSWGGHIASRLDWGYVGDDPRSAGGISGSPYHMRLREWNLNNIGNQDRSLSAAAVVDLCKNVDCANATACDGGETCDPETGLCVAFPDPPAGKLCEADGNLCTHDQCNGTGSCVNVGSVSCPGPTGPCDAGTQCNPNTGGCDALADPPLSTPCDADGDPCTTDHCNGNGSCVFLNDVSCPGPTNSCDGGKQCSNGSCIDLPDAPAGTYCDLDGNLCTVDECNGTGQCVQQSTVSCSHLDDACRNASCNPATGMCVVTNEPASTPCEADGNLCTDDHCNGSGSCVLLSTRSCPGPTNSCDGGQSCNPSTGMCVNNADAPLSTPCEADGNLCTDDHCNGSGSCVFLSNRTCPGPTNSCDGGQSCQPSTGNCVNNPDAPLSTPCEADGNLCTDDHCNGSGSCVLLSNRTCPGSSGPCDGGQSCQPSTGNCVNNPDAPLSTPCEADGNLCTDDHCNGSGSCVLLSNRTCPGSTGACDAGQSCQPSTGMCVNNPDPSLSTPCEADGNLCTDDHCDGNGNCVFLSNRTCPGPTNSCDGGQSCNPSTGMCMNEADAPLSTPCEADGNLCTDDHCNGSGSCVFLGNRACPGSTGQCDAGQSCQPSTGMCVNDPDPPLSTPCEADGDLCTNDHCDGSGSCVFLSDVTCPGPTNFCDGGQSCDPLTGMCENEPDQPLSTPCEADGDLCTNDHCNGNGSCVFLSNRTCPSPTNSCDGGQSCNPSNGMCQDNADSPLSTPCEADGNLCTHDHCNGAGACVTFDEVECAGSSNPCDAGEQCDPDTGVCEFLADPPLSTPCEADGNLCTKDHCNGSGSCVNFGMVSCPGSTGPCDAGQSCQPSTGMCVNNPDPPLSTPCEADGNLCTDDHCNGTGSCVFLSLRTCPGPTGFCDGGQACNPSTGLCANEPDAPLSTPCEADGNLCTDDHCNGSGSCVFLSNRTCPGSTGPCDAGQACDPGTGECEHLADPPLSTPCEADGNLCTDDHCNGSGSCVFLSLRTCPGSTGFCDGGQACNPSNGMCEDEPDQPLSTPCEADGNLCTDDHCNGSGSCVFLSNRTCPDPTGFCDGGQTCNPSNGLCEHNPDQPLSTPCEADGDLCTDDHCDGFGSCVFLSSRTCPGPTGFCDGGQSCNPSTGMCVDNADAALSTPCEADGDLCTDDHCNGMGACVLLSTRTCSNPAGECDAGEVCNPSTGMCDSVPDAPLSTPCEADGNLCTDDHCDGNGNCVFLSTRTCPGATGFCDGGQACNPSTGMCENNPDQPLSTPCEADGNLCTDDHCNGNGSCVLLSTRTCPASTGFCDGGQSCNPSTGMCDHNPDQPLSTPCEADGDLCTNDHCNGSGSCVFLSDLTCQASTGPCDGGEMCNSSTGNCDALPDATLSTPCEADGDMCTVDHCNGTGQCVFLKDVTCAPAVPPCEGGTICNPSTGGCDAQPDAPLSTPCEADDNPCTVDHCDGMGSCVFLDDVHCNDPVPPCEAGEMCNPNTGVCEALPDAPLSTPCELEGDLCTIDHCNGQGACVFLDDVECDDPVPPCEAGAACNSSTGMCEDQDDAPLSTPCEADNDTCTMDHCDGNGACVLELLLCGACCNGNTGGCVDDEVFEEECVGDQREFSQGADCATVIASGECARHRGACCDTSPGAGDCVNGVFPEDCDPTGNDPQRTWYKGLSCSQIGPCEEARGACCNSQTGTCTNNVLVASCTCSHCTWHKGASCNEIACNPDLGACCEIVDQTASCTQTTQAACNCANCSWSKGASCDEVVCDPTFTPIPTVSEWGLLIMALLLLTGGKVYFGRREQLA